jgi:hypothetical protein
LDRVQAVGRGRETAFLGDREEGLELTNIHAGPLCTRLGSARPRTS